MFSTTDTIKLGSFHVSCNRRARQELTTLRAWPPAPNAAFTRSRNRGGSFPNIR
jgi:hypothetical protein